MQNKPNFLDAQINVTSFDKRDYGDLATLRLPKNKPNSNPNKPNFAQAQMNATIYFTRNYENNPPLRLRQNKPNSNPIFKKPGMNVNKVLTKDYENQPPRGSKSNQTQLVVSLPALSEAEGSNLFMVSLSNPFQNVEKLLALESIAAIIIALE